MHGTASAGMGAYSSKSRRRRRWWPVKAAQFRRPGLRRGDRRFLLGTAGAALGLFAAIFFADSLPLASAMTRTGHPHFSICSGPIRTNCVVDGDTIWLKGEKIRIADIDTPEISTPKCRYEEEHGYRAQGRLRDLLNNGPIDLARVDRDRDRYGRLLRIIKRDGKSLGGQLVSEGLARHWTGRRESWCGQFAGSDLTNEDQW